MKLRVKIPAIYVLSLILSAVIFILAIGVFMTHGGWSGITQADMDRAPKPTPSPTMEVAAERVATLARRQAGLAAEQARLAHRMRKADASERAELEHQHDALSAQSEALSAQLQAQNAQLQAESARMHIAADFGGMELLTARFWSSVPMVMRRAWGRP